MDKSMNFLRLKNQKMMKAKLDRRMNGNARPKSDKYPIDFGGTTAAKKLMKSAPIQAKLAIKNNQFVLDFFFFLASSFMALQGAKFTSPLPASQK
jgi:hypothetical protein